MAIYPKEHTAPQPDAPTGPPSNAAIEAWATEAAESLNTLTISSPSDVRGTSVSLAIDLDEHAKREPAKPTLHPTYPRRRLLRRDSLERREALLKGKDGSRRRMRWENDRLLHNPWAQAPLPGDWEVQPTYPRRAVPYYLAPLWDDEMAARSRGRQALKSRQNLPAHGTARTRGQGDVPRELKDKLKRAKAAKGLLRDLEEQVRHFVENWQAKNESGPESRRGGGRRGSATDSSDEEIVFVGRHGKMRDVPASPKFLDGEDSSPSDIDNDAQAAPNGSSVETLVFDSLASDRSAGFGRWLVHNIAQYYGLRTWSRTIGDPARREAYVGLPFPSTQTQGAEHRQGSPFLPEPLWIMV